MLKMTYEIFKWNSNPNDYMDLVKFVTTKVNENEFILNEDSIIDDLVDPEVEIYLAKEKEKLIGYIAVRNHHNVLYIKSSKSGIGKALLLFLVNKYEYIKLIPMNTKLISYYESLGFVLTNEDNGRKIYTLRKMEE